MARQVSMRQLEILLDFLEQNKRLALGAVRGREGKPFSIRLWTQCAKVLNADPEGSKKSALEWKKFYNQFKSRTKTKSRNIKAGIWMDKTGGGPATKLYLTPLEERLISIVGESTPPTPGNQSQCEAWTNEISFPGSNDGNQASPTTIHEKKKILNKVKIEPGIQGAQEIKFINEEGSTEDVFSSDSELESGNKPHNTRKRPMRLNNNVDYKRLSRHSSTSSKENNDYRESRLKVDREIAQAINRLASSMESIAGAITNFSSCFHISGKVNVPGPETKKS